MRHIRNIPISDKTDYQIQQGESCFKYVILVFLAAVWLCRDVTQSDFGKPVNLYRPVVYHQNEMPETSLKILGWRLL